MQIAVSGPVGAGKTTFTRGLAKVLRCSSLVEDPDINPFLAAFYADHRTHAFATQAWFQVHTLGQLHQMTSRDGGYVLERTVDERHFVFVETLHAAGLLDAGERAALSLIARNADCLNLKPWSVVIALECPARVLVDRVQQRGKYYERRLDLSWFESHIARYREYWAQLATPVLKIDTTKIDLRSQAAVEEVAVEVTRQVSLSERCEATGFTRGR